MAHEHHSHSHSNASKNIGIAFILNGVFVVVELVGGILTNSVAILSDALHDFGDCISLAIAWVLQKRSNKGRDAKYSYGYKRFSLLGSVFLSGILTVSSIVVVIEAVKRILEPQSVNAQGMLYLAIAGVVINGAAAFRLSRGSSLNERAVFLHIIEDVLGWVAVLVVSVVMMFVDVPVLDPVLSIAISVWVMSNVYKNLRDTFKILLQATPDDVDVAKLSSQIESVEGITSIHDLHVWSLDGESHVMTLHVVTPLDDTSRLKVQIIGIAKEHNINHSTIEFEGEDCVCIHNCD